VNFRRIGNQRMRHQCVALYAIALARIFLGAQAAGAQSSFCFRGRPFPRCHTFAVFEMTGTKRLGGGTSSIETIVIGPPDVTYRGEDLPRYLSWNLGAMVNRDSIHADGGMLELGFSSSGARVAAKVRHRRWFGGTDLVDLTAGVLGAEERDVHGQRTTYGVTADAAIGEGDVLALTLGGDLTSPLSRARSHAAIHVGVRLGSYATLGLTTLMLAALATIAVNPSNHDF
jgi:hypothetical protein